ncbi:MAG TPA: nucleotidyltransferase family protein [Verrucomicrobiae bacterium]|jgi:NDP-sugar pyrophosphorylase family protein
MPESFPVAILAGGLATRLRPITEKIPKSLVTVAGRPFLAHQIELLRGQGLRHFVLCVGHLGEMIQRDFGDGASYGVKLEYSFDGDKLLGTGGALRKALPLLGEDFFVLYGDSYLPIDFNAVSAGYRSSRKPALMTVYANKGKWDTSNVWFEDGEIKVYDKKNKRPEMHHIDYGLSVFNQAVFDSVAIDQPIDLAAILMDLLARKQLAGFEVNRRFYEIGSPTGLAELDDLLKSSHETGKLGA